MALSGNYSKTPKAFIFDLDGTLLDTEPLYTIATQKVLDPYGAQFTMDLKRQCMGGDSRQSARIVIDHFSLPMDETEYLASREIHLRDLFPDAPSMPGAEQFLRSLSEAQVPVGLATSSHQHLMELKFQFYQYFQWQLSPLAFQNFQQTYKALTYFLNHFQNLQLHN